ncbi:hypothetical protein QYE76_004780 [Lolium multiflorum]|uniref:CCHC-type domain-containing protein n=1 Tax=Lolium multiflorum TaxID=4521 RepID=A0AAD8W046_LOLMU|nr:hypothetical protein QYE76_004780 [Lolium multiflorum]
MQTVLVKIPFRSRSHGGLRHPDRRKLHQANENRKRRMMNQHGSGNTQKYRNNSSGGYAPRYNKPTAQNYRPNNTNNHGGPPKPGGNNNTNNNNNNTNPNSNNNNGNNNNNNTGPRTGSNAIPVATKDKATITCYECGVVGHYSNECPKSTAHHVLELHLDLLPLPIPAIAGEEDGTRQTARAQGNAEDVVGAPTGVHWPRATPTPDATPGPPLSALSFAAATPVCQKRSMARASPIADDQLAIFPRPCRQTLTSHARTLSSPT